MRLHRFIPHVALMLLVLCSLGGKRLHRNPLWANRPVSAANNPARASVLPIALQNGGNAATNQMSPNSAMQAIAGAYSLLASADHDYNGHRVEAMKSLHKAAKKLKVNLTGQGTGGKLPQGDSDAKLRKAQQILQQVRGSYGGSRRGAMVRQHINEAIQHITTALQTR
jgi:hypothetical protein